MLTYSHVVLNNVYSPRILNVNLEAWFIKVRQFRRYKSYLAAIRGLYFVEVSFTATIFKLHRVTNSV